MSVETAPAAARPLPVPRRPGARRAAIIPALIFLALALVPILGALGVLGRDEYLLGLVTRVMIFALVAVSLDLILGYGGLVSFGHAALVGIGAYIAGIFLTEGTDNALLLLILSMGAAGLFALVTGAVSLRTKGVAFIMITLAFGQMAFFTAGSLATYGGDDGLTLYSRPRLFGLDPFGTERARYALAFAFLLGGYLLSRAIVASRFGRVVRAARENPARTAALGFNPTPFQLALYVVAGAMAGAAGFLLAVETQFVSPAYMSWQRSGELLVMVILGGMGTLHGAVLGAAAFLLIEEKLPEWLGLVHPVLRDNWKVVFGPLLVVIVLFARGGLAGVLDRLTGARRG